MIKKSILELFEKQQKKYLSLKELHNFTRTDKQTLKVILSRMKKKQEIYALGNSFYAINPQEVNFEQLACELNRPSYISLESALSHYGILSQIPSSLTLITPQKTVHYNLNHQRIEYSKIKNKLFFGFTIQGQIAIAEAEKALLDELYFIGIKKRSLNLGELDLSKINKEKFKEWLSFFPPSTKKLAQEILFRKK